MTELSVNNDYYSSGRSALNGHVARNFTTSGSSNFTGLVCADQFCSSGKTQIQSSRLNHVRVSGSTQLIQSTANKIQSSGYFQAVDCSHLGRITGSGNTSIARCKNIEEIKASGRFSLDSSSVRGNVTLSGKPIIVDSAIEGVLECAAKIIKIRNSSIGKIVVKPTYITGRFEFFPSWSVPISYTSFSSPSLVEQVVELSGKDCQIGSITFVDGAIGSVRLINGATITNVSGGKVIS